MTREEKLAYDREYRKNNKEKIVAYYKRYALADPERFKAYQKKNYAKHSEQRKKDATEYRVNNPDKIREVQRNNYLNRRDKKIDLAKEYVKTHMDEHRAAGRKRRLQERLTNDKTINKKSISLLLESQDFKCKICYCDISINLHKDHIIPLCENGAHSITNIQLLCPTCNRRKHKKENNLATEIINNLI